MILFLLFFVMASASEEENYWNLTFEMTVRGSYRLQQDNNDNNKKGDRQGNYEFKILAGAVIEQDVSKDYLLYPGEWKVSGLKWQEDGNDISAEVKPQFRVNYVLNEYGNIYCDLEVFPEGELKEILLPRSRLNKSMHPEDKYNKGVKKGSNTVKIPERRIMKQKEFQKEFNWTWKRDKDGYFNTHTVLLTVKAISNR